MVIIYKLRFFLRCTIFISSMAFMSHCRSTVGEGTRRAEQTTTKIEQVKQTIRSSNLSENEKGSLISQLDGIGKDVNQLGKDVDTNKKIADDNAEGARMWFWTKVLGGVLLAGGLAFAVKKIV